MMTQKSNPYTEIFSTLSGVRRAFSSLSQLNILCTRPAKQCYAKITVDYEF